VEVQRLRRRRLALRALRSAQAHRAEAFGGADEKTLDGQGNVVNPLAWLNPYRWLLAAALIAALSIGFVTAKHHYDEGKRDEGRAEGRHEVQAKWDHEREAQKDAALREAQANALETKRRMALQEDFQRERDQQMAAAERDARGLRGELGELQQWADAQRAAARRACGDSAASCNGSPAADPAGVLADVLGRVAARSALLAGYADSARIAGEQCERSYDALTRTDKAAEP
jgi:hypothetical protein